MSFSVDKIKKRKKGERGERDRDKKRERGRLKILNIDITNSQLVWTVLQLVGLPTA